VPLVVLQPLKLIGRQGTCQGTYYGKEVLTYRRFQPLREVPHDAL
jgi:hypothetical protein